MMRRWVTTASADPRFGIYRREATGYVLDRKVRPNEDESYGPITVWPGEVMGWVDADGIFRTHNPWRDVEVKLPPEWPQLWEMKP